MLQCVAAYYSERVMEQAQARQSLADKMALCKYMCIHIHGYICICVYTYIYTYTYTYIHIYIYVHTATSLHIGVFPYFLNCKCSVVLARFLQSKN